MTNHKCHTCGEPFVEDPCGQCGHQRALHDEANTACGWCSCPNFLPNVRRVGMTPQEFDSWAYAKLTGYLADTSATADEQRGFDRIKAFIAGIEGDRAVLVSE